MIVCPGEIFEGALVVAMDALGGMVADGAMGGGLSGDEGKGDEIRGRVEGQTLQLEFALSGEQKTWEIHGDWPHRALYLDLDKI